MLFHVRQLLAESHRPGLGARVQGYVNSICTSITMVLAVIILLAATRRSRC
jgi:hypothetical protein